MSTLIILAFFHDVSFIQAILRLEFTHAILRTLFLFDYTIKCLSYYFKVIMKMREN